jgi:purine-binding chemotaxis protein CheW
VVALERRQGEEGEVQLVVFSAAGEEYALDVAHVREIIRMDRITRVPRSPPWVEGVINLRGQVTTVIDLGKRLGLPVSAASDATRIVIVEREGAVAGLIVDAVAEVMRLPRVAMAEAPSLLSATPASTYVRGIAKVGERILILLDLDKVLNFEENRTAVEAVAPQG